MHAPATEVYPDLIPTTPFVPTSETMLCSVPTSGSVTEGIATTSAKVGMAIPADATRSTSDADDTERGSYPLAST